MESRDLPDGVEATFGVGSSLSVKTLTLDPSEDPSATLLHGRHSSSGLAFTHPRAPDLAHSILRFASQNYYPKSRIPDPDPCHSGGLGQH